MVTFDEILQKSHYIANHSASVRINKNNVLETAEKIIKQPIIFSNITMPNELSFEEQLLFVFIWGLSDFYHWNDSGEYNDSEALKACYQSALEHHVNILNISVVEQLNIPKYQKILEQNTACQWCFLPERLQFIQHGIRVLKNKYQGSVFLFLQECSFDAEQITNALSHEFLGLDDSHFYWGIQMHFLYRAQKITFHLDQIYFEQTGAHFKNIDKLVMGSDEKTICALGRLGCLNYIPPLQDNILSGQDIPAGSPWEVQLRSNAVAVIDKIKKIIFDNIEEKRSPDNIEQVLWLLAQTDFKEDIPPHKTLTWFY